MDDKRILGLTNFHATREMSLPTDRPDRLQRQPLASLTLFLHPSGSLIASASGLSTSRTNGGLAIIAVWRWM